MLAGTLMAGTCAFALNPALDVSQYAHTAWKIRDGFVKGSILSIAQTPDGYLWVGSAFGLSRFDGVRNVPWEPPPNQHLPSTVVSRLVAARDGTLWIGTWNGLASWKNGKLIQYAELGGLQIRALVEDHVRARYGPARMGLPMENFAKFGMAASGATRRFAVLATASSACMRTARGISGPVWRWVCGDGDRGRRNSIRRQVCRTTECRA